MLLAVLIDATNIKFVPKAIRVHYFQPVSLPFVESPCLSTKQQHTPTAALHLVCDCLRALYKHCICAKLP